MEQNELEPKVVTKAKRRPMNERMLVCTIVWRIINEGNEKGHFTSNNRIVREVMAEKVQQAACLDNEVNIEDVSKAVQWLRQNNQEAAMHLISSSSGMYMDRSFEGWKKALRRFAKSARSAMKMYKQIYDYGMDSMKYPTELVPEDINEFLEMIEAEDPIEYEEIED